MNLGRSTGFGQGCDTTVLDRSCMDRIDWRKETQSIKLDLDVGGRLIPVDVFKRYDKVGWENRRMIGPAKNT